MKHWPEKYWYTNHPLRWLLWPFSWIYIVITFLRRQYLEKWLQRKVKVPVIVVGNITVGGVGKTPLVIALAKACQEKGLKVGIVSRGYKATIKQFPHEVSKNDNATLVGDEPLLLAIKTHCPVVIAPKRMEAVDYLIKNHAIDIIISDDGLQHYAMARDIEIAVIDASRGLGNGFCLPAGPLRELPTRLNAVDFMVINGESAAWPHAYSMLLKPEGIYHLQSHQLVTSKDLQGSIIALAAIGNPARFFDTLKHMNITFQSRAYPDHYAFRATDFKNKDAIYIMTEKDAVKCRDFVNDAMYYLPVQAVLSESFWKAFWSHKRLQGLLK